MDVLKKFGRYFLLDQIDQGGMAEIYRARLANKDAAGRILVIKRMIANYGTNAEFIQMFKAEIKVAMGLIHPNIVQVYDFGEEQGQSFIAMEYVDGQNLRKFYSRFNELKQRFPVDLAVHVLEEACAGLHYAHTFKDPMTGEPANIIHRDISPQNIMISYEGSVKIIDFGIAKATNQSEMTRAGVIKGKPSYLSPEQISGEILDARSDVFALGIVLWELLVGKKLFQGENDLAVLKQIESCHAYVKPPSNFNPAIPKELDYLVLKALAKQREKRFQSAEEMQRALHRFLVAFNPEFNSADLGYFAKDLFKNEIVESRKKIQKLSEKVEQLLAQSVKEVANQSGAPSSFQRSGEDSTMVSSIKKRVEFEAPEVKVPTNIEIDAAPLGRSAPPKLKSASGQTTHTSPALAAFPPGMGGQSSVPPLSPTLTLETSGVSLERGRSGRENSQSRRYDRTRTLDRVARTGASGSGFGSFLKFALAGAIAGMIVLPKLGIEFTGSQWIKQYVWRESMKSDADTSSHTSRTIASLCDPKANNCVSLRFKFDSQSQGAEVFIQQQKVDPSVPIMVPVNTSLEISATKKNARSFSRNVFIDAEKLAGKQEWVEEIALEVIKYGKLTIHTRPSAIAEATIDGKKWVRQTPFENEDLPIGVYTIRIANDVLNLEKTVTVQVKEDRPTSLLEVKLEPRR